MLYDGELDHQHQNLENEVTNTRRDLLGASARLAEVDNELGAVRADLSTARHAIVELDDALTALRAEHAAFRQHAAANLASLNELAAELTAEVAKDPEFTKMVVGLLRALTFNLGGYEFRGEARPGDWDPDAEFARLAGETEADKPTRPPTSEQANPGLVWGWCHRCGQSYEGPGQPTCECAGDPPCDPDSGERLRSPHPAAVAYRERVRSLHYQPVPGRQP